MNSEASACGIAQTIGNAVRRSVGIEGARSDSDEGTISYVFVDSIESSIGIDGSGNAELVDVSYIDRKYFVQVQATCVGRSYSDQV